MPTPTPHWILRHHSPASITHIHLTTTSSASSPLLLAGDARGRVSLTHLGHYRPLCFWPAHRDSILTVHLHPPWLLTHGRDNKLSVWRLPSPQREGAAPAPVLGGTNPPLLPSRLASSLPTPDLVLTLEVNALNFARFSLLLLPRAEPGDDAGEDLAALVAVPHTLDAAYIDVLHLPSGRRRYEAIGRPDIAPPRGGTREPIVMAMHLLRLPLELEGDGRRGSTLACLAGYEDGSVRLWTLASEQEGWTEAWRRRTHSESVMDLAVTSSLRSAVSVSADDRISRYDLSHQTDVRVQTIESGTAGNAAAAISTDDSTLAVAGWDGSIRMYDLGTLSFVGSLGYHRDTVQTVAFGQVDAGRAVGQGERSEEFGSGSDSETDEGGGAEGKRSPGGRAKTLMAAGGKDGKISLWWIF